MPRFDPVFYQPWLCPVNQTDPKASVQTVDQGLQTIDSRLEMARDDTKIKAWPLADQLALMVYKANEYLQFLYIAISISLYHRWQR